MNYQGRSNKLEHSFSVIISWLRSRFCEKQLTSLSKLYVGKGTEELFVIFLRKSARYALTGMVVAGVLCALFVISSSKKHEIWHGNMMERSEAGGRDKTIEMQIETEDGKQDYTVKLRGILDCSQRILNPVISPSSATMSSLQKMVG